MYTTVLLCVWADLASCIPHHQKLVDTVLHCTVLYCTVQLHILAEYLVLYLVHRVWKSHPKSLNSLKTKACIAQHLTHFSFFFCVLSRRSLHSHCQGHLAPRAPMPPSGRRIHRHRRYPAPTGASCALGTSNETEKRREEKRREEKRRVEK